MTSLIWNFGTVCAAIDSGSRSIYQSFEREFVELAIKAFGERSWDCGCMRQQFKERKEHAGDLLVSLKGAKQPAWQALLDGWREMGTGLELVTVVKALAKKALYRCRTCRRRASRRGELEDYDRRPREPEDDLVIKARVLEQIWMDVEKLVPDTTEREVFLLRYRERAEFEQIQAQYPITRMRFDDITRKVRDLLTKRYNNRPRKS